MADKGITPLNFEESIAIGSAKSECLLPQLLHFLKPKAGPYMTISLPRQREMKCQTIYNYWTRSSRSDKKFDEVIGHIEDIIMDDAFQQLQNDFMDKHYHHFEDIEENKLIYTDIFQQYTNLIEKYLEESLKQRIPGFSMEQFMGSLMSRKDQIGGDIFEMLLSFSDFLMFKQTFLDYKADKEGTNVDLGGLIITPLTNVEDTSEQMAVDSEPDIAPDRQSSSTNVPLSS